MGQAVSFQTY